MKYVNHNKNATKNESEIENDLIQYCEKKFNRIKMFEIILFFFQNYNRNTKIE